MGYLFKIGVLTSKHSHFKNTKMKNSFKLGALALVIAVSISACGGAAKTGAADSTVKVDSTVKKDTVVKVDTAAKKDTTKKK
jgi:ABC-type glycerol-3-phosphate transport system substrate-binding protein